MNNCASHTAVQWATNINVAMDELDTVCLMATLGAKAEELEAADARAVMKKMGILLEVIHNDLDVLQEKMRETVV